MEKVPESIPEEFYDLVDEFIDMAKKLNKRWPTSRVSATLLYAAARFNTYTWMKHNSSSETETGEDEAARWYAHQYKKMFLLNVAELKKAKIRGEENSSQPGFEGDMTLTGTGTI